MTAQVLALTSFMAFLGLWAFYLASDSGPVLMAAFAASCGAGLFVSHRKKLALPGALWNIAAAVVLVVFIADYLAFSKEIITAATRLLALLLALKLFGLKKGSDFLLAYALVFFLILAAAVSTVSLAFFGMLGLYVMAAVWAMMLFSVERDMRASGLKAQAASGVFGPRFFIVVVAMTTASLVMTLALFFVMPRVGVGVFQRKALNTVKTTGFSDIVDLGSLGPAKEDSTIVMRAEFPGGRPARTVYFKGAILEEYDGRSWKREPSPGFIKRQSGAEGFVIGPGQGRSTEVAVLLEPLDTEVLFTVPNVYRLEGPFQSVRAEKNGVIRLPSALFSRVQYRLWTDLSRVNADERAPDGPVDARYLDASEEGRRIKELATEVAQTGLPLEKASAIEAYLRANYRYTLSPASSAGKSPVEDFLFYSKEGYCEHYATAMVMLLRATGIHSRLVTGFLEGEWSELGGYFMVRQKDAHSWVEAYVDGAGWMRFDPTPSAPAPPHRASAISLYLDLLRLKWNRHIIQFTFADQRRLALSAERKATGALAGIREVFRLGKPALSGKGAITAALIAIALIITALFLLKWMSWKKRRKNGAGFYFEMLRALKARGVVKRPEETPLEFSRRVDDRRVSEITEAFNMERYGRKKTGADALERIKRIIRELRKG